MDGVKTWPNALWRRTEATRPVERLVFPIDVSGMIMSRGRGKGGCFGGTPRRMDVNRVGGCSWALLSALLHLHQAPSGCAHTPARVEEHRRRMTAALGNTGMIGRLAATSQERGSWPPQFSPGSLHAVPDRGNCGVGLWRSFPLLRLLPSSRCSGWLRRLSACIVAAVAVEMVCSQPKIPAGNKVKRGRCSARLTLLLPGAGDWRLARLAVQACRNDGYDLRFCPSSRRDAVMPSYLSCRELRRDPSSRIELWLRNPAPVALASISVGSLGR
jgi:hypothetical protein